MVTENQDQSEIGTFNFTDAIVGNTKPLVIGNGAWTNIGNMQPLGELFAFDKNNARDTWIIEITGGPETECETCPNYDFDDLTEFYWPALIAGVINYSGQPLIDYLGYSNGCRVGLESLKNYSSSGKTEAGYCYNLETGYYDIQCSLPSNPVDAYVGVACVGAFDGDTPFTGLVTAFGSPLISGFEQQGVTHISFPEYALKMILFCNLDSSSNECYENLIKAAFEPKLSVNLLKDYHSFITSDIDPQPGQGLSINKFGLINGKFEYSGSFLYDDVDGGFGLSLINDRDGILEGVDGTKEFNDTISAKHGQFISDMSTILRTKYFVEGVLNE